MLALAARGLSDGPPSAVAVARRLELVERYDEAWRTLSWSEHLTLDVPYPHLAPRVSGGSLVLPIRHNDSEELVRSFIVQSIPSPLRGVPGQHWRVNFDFSVKTFVIDATQDLLAIVPLDDPQKSLRCLYLLHIYLRGSFAACECALCRQVSHIHFPPTVESFV